MRDPAHKIMGATNSKGKIEEKNSSWSEAHRETYAALLHHNLPKTLQLRQRKVGKTATGKNTCDQRYNTGI